ncbi:adenosine deaminase [Aspergillus sergii]|uniref:Adenosine deaminase n=1 Tax=Aspergillus sergii TaxID=1034303 RepID=A0A5N6X3Y7_9EURO|nr:adenosine deaminase [Aspergillus sergii]
MSSSKEVLSNATIREYRDLIRNHGDDFIKKMPKVEMHVHIEGTMTPELRWSLAVRHRMPIPNPRTGKYCCDLSELEGLYDLLGDLEQGGVEGGMLRFFELYYGGFDVLRDEEDFYLLAMNYFQRAAKMNIRYCEPFFDPQGHTRRDVSLGAVMKGFRRAQLEAAEKLNVQSQWIMCFLRDMSPESAMSHYIDALPYRDMIVGIGLDSLETDRPPLLFEDVFQRAREDGFKITCHCDVGAKDSLRHIAQVIDQLGGTGADRIDHGLHAADDPSLLSKVKEKGLGMTICPWGYLCYSGETQILERIRIIHDAGIKIAIGSDDPAYMEDIWLNNSLYMLRELCHFTDDDFVALQRYAVDICWASTDVKTGILAELEEYQKQAQ